VPNPVSHHQAGMYYFSIDLISRQARNDTFDKTQSPYLEVSLGYARLRSRVQYWTEFTGPGLGSGSPKVS
jgi:hypothetical protein